MVSFAWGSVFSIMRSWKDSLLKFSNSTTHVKWVKIVVAVVWWHREQQSHKSHGFEVYQWHLDEKQIEGETWNGPINNSSRIKIEVEGQGTNLHPQRNWPSDENRSKHFDLKFWSESSKVTPKQKKSFGKKVRCFVETIRLYLSPTFSDQGLETL